MSEHEGLAGWLGRSARGAQDDARRIVRELLARGDISEAEAAQIEAGVSEAVERGLQFVQERVAGPLQSVASGALRAALGDRAGEQAPDRSDEILARLEALDARIAGLERRLAGRPERGEE